MMGHFKPVLTLIVRYGAQMGYDFGVPLPGGYHGLQSRVQEMYNPNVEWVAIDCQGTEESIWDCDQEQTGYQGRYCDNEKNSVALYCSRFC